MDAVESQDYANLGFESQVQKADKAQAKSGQMDGKKWFSQHDRTAISGGFQRGNQGDRKKILK